MADRALLAGYPWLHFYGQVMVCLLWVLWWKVTGRYWGFSDMSLHVVISISGYRRFTIWYFWYRAVHFQVRSLARSRTVFISTWWEIDKEEIMVYWELQTVNSHILICYAVQCLKLLGSMSESMYSNYHRLYFSCDIGTVYNCMFAVVMRQYNFHMIKK